MLLLSLCTDISEACQVTPAPPAAGQCSKAVSSRTQPLSRLSPFLAEWSWARAAASSPSLEITRISTPGLVVVVVVVQSAKSYGLQSHGLLPTRLPCPTLSPRICSNPCPLSWWCHLTISSFVVPFCSCPSSFPSSRSFPMSRLFTSSGQSIGVSASVLPMNIQGWFPLGLTGLISLLPTGLLGVFCRLAIQIANETIHREHSVQCLMPNKKERNGRKEGRRKEGKKKHDFSTHFYYLSLLFVRRLRKICLLPSDMVIKRHCSLLSTSA